MSLVFSWLQVNRLTKSGVCTMIKEHIHKLKGKARRVTWIEKKAIHLQQQAEVTDSLRRAVYCSTTNCEPWCHFCLWHIFLNEFIKICLIKDTSILECTTFTLLSSTAHVGEALKNCGSVWPFLLRRHQKSASYVYYNHGGAVFK